MQQSSYPYFHNTKQVLIKQGKTFGLLIICTWKKGNNSEIWITGIMWTQERYFLYFSGTNRTKRRKV